MTLRLQLVRSTPSAARAARLAVEALEERTVLSSTLTPGSPSIAAVAPTAVVSATAGGNASTLSSITVTFNQALKASSFTASDLGLLGPAGRVTITSVKPTDSTDRTFVIGFAAQTRAGVYTLYVGANAVDLAGNHIAAYQAQFRISGSTPTSTPTVAPHVVSATAGGSTSTLSGITLTFDRAISPSSFTVSNLELLGPAGRVTITSVRATDSTDRTFVIGFAAQTRAGVYTLYVGASPVDLAGHHITAYQTQFKVAAPTLSTGPTPTGMLSFSSTASTAIPAGGMGVSMVSVNNAGKVGSVTVTLTINHPVDGELYIHLQAPDGTDVVLSNRMGAGAANFTNVTFDDHATRAIAFSAGPFSGAYQPIGPLSTLAGKSMQGLWKLWVVDLGSHSGTLVNWTLTVRPA